VDTLALGANARPQNLRLLPGGRVLAVTEPNDGVVSFYDLNTKSRSTMRATVTDLQFLRNTAYLANQIGGSAAYASFVITPGGVNLANPSSIALDPGVRSVAIDPLDNLLLVSSESSGAISLIDLTANRIVGSISAVRSPSETAARDDRSDRERANNTPVISSILPAQAAAGTTVQLAVNSSYANGALEAFFVDENGNRDQSLFVSGMDVDPTGNQVRITVQIPPGAAKGEHVLRIFTPNGESAAAPLQGNLLTIL
jgi:hypothetical protein